MGYTAAVITVSDKGYAGQREDTSGPALVKMLEDNDWDVVYKSIVPDEFEMIRSELVKASDELKVQLCLTTGGSGFAARDITPEVTLDVCERMVPGIPEAMRAASMKITDRGCLSRSVAGIRKSTLIVNLPGSKKASTENLEAVIGALKHGAQMLLTTGSANCAEESAKEELKKEKQQADELTDNEKIGMYLTHVGIVRTSARAQARDGKQMPKVTGMELSYDKALLDELVKEALSWQGIYHVDAKIFSGRLKAGDKIMEVTVGGDIRPNVLPALEKLVGRIKNECVTEKELF
ncbi:MAG: MogA/MoaB family molybdenum cofactor biosynthesis protein [Lachnospiraceae bacterium]|jgi:molybdopterin adenylyltransferase